MSLHLNFLDEGKKSDILQQNNDQIKIRDRPYDRDLNQLKNREAIK